MHNADTMNTDIQVRTLEFTIQSLLIRLADARYGDASASAEAVAAWSNAIDLPIGDCASRACRDLEVDQIIERLTSPVHTIDQS